MARLPRSRVAWTNGPIGGGGDGGDNGKIRSRLKDMDLPRYKYMVQVVLGEQRGEGVRVGCRTLWDADTDSFATATFTSDELFCSATAYAMYLY